MTDPGFDLDIVERALAIVDEEWRAWVARQRGVSPAEGTPGSGEGEGRSRGESG